MCLTIIIKIDFLCSKLSIHSIYYSGICKSTLMAVASSRWGLHLSDNWQYAFEKWLTIKSLLTDGIIDTLVNLPKYGNWFMLGRSFMQFVLNHLPINYIVQSTGLACMFESQRNIILRFFIIIFFFTKSVSPWNAMKPFGFPLHKNKTCILPPPPIPNSDVLHTCMLAVMEGLGLALWQWPIGVYTVLCDKFKSNISKSMLSSLCWVQLLNITHIAVATLPMSK